MTRDPERYLVSGYYRWSLSLRYAQRFSMRFMFRELNDYFIIINPCSLAVFLSQSRVKLAIWDLALSCWNVISHKSSTLNASMNSRSYWSRMTIYYSFLIESSINAIDSNLLPIKHPHIICDNSSSRFFVTIFFGIYFFTLFWYFHIHTMRMSLFFWIANSLDHIIIAQSSII